MASGKSALLRDWSGRMDDSPPNAKPEKANKYGAKPVVVAGLRFDSKAEFKRYKQLQMLQHAGEISQLQHQVSYTLVPGVRYKNSTRIQPPIRYIADFVYLDKRGIQVIEDVKGIQTPAFKLKRHLMLALHGLDIHIVKVR